MDNQGSVESAYKDLCAAIDRMEKAHVDPTSIEAIKNHAEGTRTYAERLARETAYFGALARKYRHAARYPWLPLEPDPPGPERPSHERWIIVDTATGRLGSLAFDF
jgi:hypothetical protein